MLLFENKYNIASCRRRVKITPPGSCNLLLSNKLGKTLFALVIFLAGFSVSASGQITLKSNILYDALATPNIGAEVGVGRKNSLALLFGLNPWTSLGSNTRGDRYARHWLLMPEYRWWTCTRYNGHFFGVHAFGGEMDFSNISFPFPGFFFGGTNLGSAVKGARFQGGYFGVGASYGYQWALSRHWGIEGEVGVGYGHVIYDRYPCTTCGSKVSSGHSNYIGVTKLAISIIYVP